MKENKHSLKISRSCGDITLDGYPIATYSNDELKILKNLLEKVLCEENEYCRKRLLRQRYEDYAWLLLQLEKDTEVFNLTHNTRDWTFEDWREFYLKKAKEDKQ